MKWNLKTRVCVALAIALFAFSALACSRDPNNIEYCNTNPQPIPCQGN